MSLSLGEVLTVHEKCHFPPNYIWLQIEMYKYILKMKEEKINKKRRNHDCTIQYYMYTLFDTGV